MLGHHPQEKLAVISKSPLLVPPPRSAPVPGRKRPGTGPLSWTSLILEHWFPSWAAHWNHRASFFFVFNSAAWVLPAGDSDFPSLPCSLAIRIFKNLSS